MKHMCRRAERSCVLKALRQTMAANDVASVAELSAEELRLEARAAQLERQKEVLKKQLQRLELLEAKGRADEPNSLKESFALC